MTNNGTFQRTHKKVAERIGDVRFLEQIQECVASRRALLGLDAPTKIAPTSPDGEQPYLSYVMAELMKLSERSKLAPQVIDGTFIEESAHPALVDEKDESQGGRGPGSQPLQETHAA